MAEDPRIEQFRKMTEADPQNELGHFSLGKALLEIGDYQAAVEPLKRTVELAPQNSRAYYLLAMAQKGAKDPEGALETLRTGYDIATERGDLMPRKDMAALMKTLGQAPPEQPEVPSAAPGPVAGAAVHPGVGETVTCRRCGQTRPKMAERPFKGPLGERVWAEVCQNCWQEWIPMGTKVINELRLNFADPRAAETYDQYMKEFLNLD